MKYHGGQIKQVVRVSKVLLNTTGDIINDIATGIANVIGGITNGTEIIADNIGSSLNNISKDLQVTSVNVLSKVGDFGLTLSKELGDVVEVVPILGKPSAYLIKGSGRGVYYVVTSVGNVVGKGVRSIGRVSKEATDLVVFTIMSASGATENTIKEAGDVVKKVAHSFNNKNGKSKTMKKKSTKTTKTKRRV